MPRPLDDVSRDLRAAIIIGEHADALRLVDEFTQVVQQKWERMTAAERAASAMPQQSQELFAWAADMAAMQQRMASEHLMVLETAHRYLNARANYLQSSAL